jgi:hypothetical protein
MQLSIDIPEGWHDITLKQYIEWVSLPDDLEPEEIVREALRIFLHLGPQATAVMKHNDRKYVMARLAEVFNKQPKLVSKFWHNGKAYGLIPNLDNITFGEYVDIEKHQEQPGQLNELMNILYRPIAKEQGDRYTIEPYNGLATITDFSGVAAAIPISAMLFFYRGGIELCLCTLSYLTAQANKKSKATGRKALSKDSAESGGGIQPSIDYAKATLQGLMKSQGCPYTECFYGFLMKAIGTHTNKKNTSNGNIR